MNKQQAIQLYESDWWKTKTARQIVEVQLFIDLLCMPFDEFHRAVEEVIGRPVWTHEFAHADLLRQEFLGTRQAPTMDEIVRLLDPQKTILVAA